MIRVSVNTFTNPNGDPVRQAFVGGMPITREFPVDDPRPVDAARRAFDEHYGKAVLLTWNAEECEREIDRK